MKRPAHASQRERLACPLYTAISVIDGRWKPMLFQRLSTGPHGFGELKRAMPGVSPRVLRAQLREMAADNLVERRTLTPPSAGVRYTLTPYGGTLGPVFETLWCWGTAHLARAGAERGTHVVPPRRRAILRRGREDGW
jgi:DNA-binding HxlR family transcriptional regulator